MSKKHFHLIICPQSRCFYFYFLLIIIIITRIKMFYLSRNGEIVVFPQQKINTGKAFEKINSKNKNKKYKKTKPYTVYTYNIYCIYKCHAINEL